MRIGHRGAAALEPENTLRSIRRALDLGVEMVEIDVRVSADGRFVVAHDDTLVSAQGQSFRVSALELSTLQGFDMGKGERLATVEEALEVIKGRSLVNLDLKVEGQARPLLRAVRDAGMVDQAIVTGDTLTSFHYLKAEEPRLWVGLSISARRFTRPRAFLERSLPALALRRASALAASGAAASADALMLEHTLISAPLVRELHRRGLRIYVWTVDRRAAMVRLKAQGVDGVTSNRVDVLVQAV